jgi:exonuclease VII small subunit
LRFIKKALMICVSFMVIAGTTAAIKAEEARFKFSDMRQDELMQVIEILENQVGTLKKNLEKYKEGVNPEYKEIQSKIDELESELQAAYKSRI